MNGIYIRQKSIRQLADQILEFYKNKNVKLDEVIVGKTIPLIQERIKKLSDYLPLCEFFFQPPLTSEVERLWDNKDLFKKISEKLFLITDWKASIIGEKMMELVKEEKMKTGEFFMILRVAMTGKKISPPLNESMEILGKEECLRRLTLI